MALTGHNHAPAPHPHDHSHGALDPVLFTTAQGIRAVKVSFLGLMVTALLQLGTVLVTGSVALLADTIHNFGDATTAIPLWIAFTLARQPPTARFSYGYGRVEDFAGFVIVLVILGSGMLAGYEALMRLFHPQIVSYLWAVGVASLIGFLGNEIVARLRLKVGKEIGSAALIADGYHARIDALTSLTVLVGACGVWVGYPRADALVGLLITGVIFKIAWDSAKSVFARLLDGVDPEVIEEIRHAASHIPEVQEVTEVRVRWVGHRLWAEVNIAIKSSLSVEQAHKIATEVRHQILHHLRYLSNTTIHIDPISASGEVHHRIAKHAHDEFVDHSH